MNNSLPSVLVVEDEALVALHMEALLEQEGFRVLGPAATVNEAIQLAGRESPTLGILDVNLFGEKVFPVADLLAERGIPFMFLTGHSQKFLPERHKNALLVQKPYDPDALLELVHGIASHYRDLPLGKHKRERELAHLQAADAHIAEARDRLERQRALIAHLTKRGHDPEIAKTIFETMANTLVAMEGQRELILWELARH